MECVSGMRGRLLELSGALRHRAEAARRLSRAKVGDVAKRVPVPTVT